MTLFTLASIGAMVFVRDMGVKSSKDERGASAALFGFIEERIAGIEDVQANGNVPYVMNRFYRAMRNVFLKGRKAWMLRVVPWNTTVVLFALAVTVVLLLGVHYYLIGNISLGTLFLIYQYTQMLNDPIEQLGDQVQEFQKAKSGMMRSQELLESRSEIVEGGKTALPEGALGLEFEHVHFSYSPDKPVLHDITFAVRPGERLGIIGRTKQRQVQPEPRPASTVQHRQRHDPGRRRRHPGLEPLGAVPPRRDGDAGRPALRRHAARQPDAV